MLGSTETKCMPACINTNGHGMMRGAQLRKQKSRNQKMRLDFERAPSNVSGGGGRSNERDTDENSSSKNQLWTLWDIY